MAKGQKKSNKEIRKPKKEKAEVKAGTAGLGSSAAATAKKPAK